MLSAKNKASIAELVKKLERFRFRKPKALSYSAIEELRAVVVALDMDPENRSWRKYTHLLYRVDKELEEIKNYNTSFEANETKWRPISEAPQYKRILIGNTFNKSAMTAFCKPGESMWYEREGVIAPLQNPNVFMELPHI